MSDTKRRFDKYNERENTNCPDNKVKRQKRKSFNDEYINLDDLRDEVQRYH
jgi:hypothetical protein